jgi:archaellum component FlaC
MRIKRFFEADEISDADLSQTAQDTTANRISNDKVDEIMGEIKEISSVMDEKLEKIEKMINTLNRFKSKSSKSNTQIDDSYLYLQEIDEKVKDTISRLDDVYNLLSDYYESGENFLY